MFSVGMFITAFGGVLILLKYAASDSLTFSGKYMLMIASCFILATDLLLAWNPICLGLVEGVIGKIQLHSGMSYKLLTLVKFNMTFCDIVLSEVACRFYYELGSFLIILGLKENISI